MKVEAIADTGSDDKQRIDIDACQRIPAAAVLVSDQDDHAHEGNQQPKSISSCDLGIKKQRSDQDDEEWRERIEHTRERTGELGLCHWKEKGREKATQ